MAGVTASTALGQHLVDSPGVGPGTKTLAGGLTSPSDRLSLDRLRLTRPWLAFGSSGPHGLGSRAGANEVAHEENRQSVSRLMHSDIDVKAGSGGHVDESINAEQVDSSPG